MTYKETLFFIGKCLTISHEEKNKSEIEIVLKNISVDWDAVVKVSTEHYVFPALYCNLKRADFLHYLPEDLVAYMEHITNLNRERNEQIIEQAKEINELLLSNDITPIFLKGTGNLLEGLYEDIGERMVGDIDFIVNKEDYDKTIQVLFDFKYEHLTKSNYHFPHFKHFPRIQKKGSIAAVEIHKELLIEKYTEEFHFEYIKKHTQQFGNITTLSYQHQLCLSIIAKQINDDGYIYKNMALRNGYDVFLLSRKTEAEKAFKEFTLLKEPLTCFLAICYEVFSKPNSLAHQSSEKTKKYVEDFYKLLENDTYRKRVTKKTHRKLFISTRLNILYKSIFDKPHRKWLLKRVTDQNWYREKAVQLKIIKQK